MPVRRRNESLHFITPPAAWVLGVAAAWGAMVPLPGRASPTLVHADLLVIQGSLINHPGVAAYESFPPDVKLPYGDPTKVGAFISPTTDSGPNWYYGGFSLGTPTNHPTEAFSSSQINGSGFADVGVSGTSEGPTLEFSTQAALIQAFGKLTNTGTQGQVDLAYTVPLMEIAHYGNRYNGVVGSVLATLSATHYDSQGNEIEELSVFDYTVTFHYEKPPTTFAILTYTASDDLLQDSGGLVDVTDCGGFLLICGKAVLPFSATKSLGVFSPGDYMTYEYKVATQLVTGREGGGHALYGDPFSFETGGGNFFKFTTADVPAGTVPEPATWALLGLAGAALVRRPRPLPVHTRTAG